MMNMKEIMGGFLSENNVKRIVLVLTIAIFILSAAAPSATIGIGK